MINNSSWLRKRCLKIDKVQIRFEDWTWCRSATWWAVWWWVSCLVAVMSLLMTSSVSGLHFKVDKFTDLSKACKRFGKKEFILDEYKPARIKSFQLKMRCYSETYIRNDKGSNSKNLKLSWVKLKLSWYQCGCKIDFLFEYQSQPQMLNYHLIYL